MSQAVRNLDPQPLWNNFADLNAVPRASKKEERVIEFMMNFGKKLGLPTSKDEVGNVIIKKPATKGMEDKPVIALQSHLDMVHQKNAATNFDFETEGIKMLVDGDWVKADGTTLGADNGIGVASIMTLLASTDIPHPPLEALFTIDEETGMTGAMGLKGGLLHAKYMLNLDTEDDHELTIGCAGGVDVTGTGNYPQRKTPEEHPAFKIGIKGLTGGHSGMDIHLGRGNANKLLNRLLYSALAAKFDIRIAEIDGGGLRNAIPRESISIIVLPNEQTADFKVFIEKMSGVLKEEHGTTDPNLQVVFEPNDEPLWVMKKGFQNQFLRAIYAVPNGIYRMSPDIKDLVQTSNNLARVLVKNGEFTIMCLTRSSVDSEKTDLAQAIEATLKLTDAKVKFSGEYPGWTPKPTSKIVELMSELYVEQFKSQPHVNACHAGLECGILGTNYPDMEMISFGPNIRGAHSPDEKVQISSVQKYWGFLLETLQRV
jgi:dipeptidase D